MDGSKLKRRMTPNPSIEGNELKGEGLAFCLHESNTQKARRDLTPVTPV